MTTNETTARGQAIELIENRIDRGQIRDVHLHNALRTLLPDLRALAGVPDQTADRAAIERVRALHRPNRFGICETCLDEEPLASGDCGGATWPCPTVRALDGDAGEEER